MVLLALRCALSFCALFVFMTLAQPAQANALRLVIHDDSGNEGDALPLPSRFAALKQTIEAAAGRPVEVTVTRDRVRVRDLMERNLGDLFIVDGIDLAARALTSLGFNFVATGRPDVNSLFISKSGPIENLKQLSGKAVAMPPTDALGGKMCAAELRDFVGTQFTPRPSREYSAVVWAVENNVEAVGCIPSHARAVEGLEAKKLKVVYEGRMVPAKAVVSSLTLRDSERVAIARALSALDDEGAGKTALKSIRVTGFTEGGETRLRSLAGWLKDR
jgi:ABC-type phosphate/phosphonate transport system substrate-binding protein